MRKDRACPYSNNPMMLGMYPMMPGYPMPIPTFDTGNTSSSSNLEERLNNLERRVSRLESSLNDTTITNNYSNTSYQMM